jgi:hypothetical protein
MKTYAKTVSRYTLPAKGSTGITSVQIVRKKSPPATPALEAPVASVPAAGPTPPVATSSPAMTQPQDLIEAEAAAMTVKVESEARCPYWQRPPRSQRTRHATRKPKVPPTTLFAMKGYAGAYKATLGTELDQLAAIMRTWYRESPLTPALDELTEPFSEKPVTVEACLQFQEAFSPWAQAAIEAGKADVFLSQQVERVSVIAHSAQQRLEKQLARATAEVESPP